ncbi:TPA: LL-diaminopimelate aminotransferase, partial [Candidatus Sumerlaeota bacterium]|nr:LL-diaminopimelate aminotransferase [Candidatus Sumerlaeota bacterium]
MTFSLADRLQKLPPYIFLEIDRLKKEAIANGTKILDFGVGDPDVATPAPIIEEMQAA